MGGRGCTWDKSRGGKVGGKLYLGQIKRLGLVPVGLQEGVVGQPDGADAAGRLVQRDVVAQRQYRPAHTHTRN